MEPVEPPTEVSPLQIVATILRRRRLIAGLPLAAAGVVVALALVSPPRYTAWMAFAPDQGSGQLSSLAGVAAEFGVSLPSSDNSQSPQFYVELISGRSFLEEVVAQPIAVPVGGSIENVRLDTLLGTTDPDPIVARTLTGRELGRLVLSDISASSGITKVTLTLRSPEAAKGILERILAQIQEFDTRTRQSRARYERQFIEQRATEVAESLRVAEGAAAAFLARNRDIRNSPQLQFEGDRLQRAVALRQGLLTALLQSLEQARIDQVRSEPGITIVERPNVSVLPDRRRLLLKMVLTVLGTLCVLLVGLVAEAYYRQALREDQALSAEIAHEAREMGGQWGTWLQKLVGRVFKTRIDRV